MRARGRIVRGGRRARPPLLPPHAATRPIARPHGLPVPPTPPHPSMTWPASLLRGVLPTVLGGWIVSGCATASQGSATTGTPASGERFTVQFRADAPTVRQEIRASVEEAWA